MTSINDPRSGYNAQTGKVEEFSMRRRPETSNADEWALWLQEHADYGIEFKAVQIAEALDSMHRGGFNACGRIASAMLAALRAVQETLDARNMRMPVVDNAIAQAEAAGIKAED